MLKDVIQLDLLLTGTVEDLFIVVLNIYIYYTVCISLIMAPVRQYICIVSTLINPPNMRNKNAPIIFEN